jgi:hypothetical protein
MSEKGNYPTRLQYVEHELAHQAPFGDLDYLNQATISRYIHRLGMVSHYLPSAAQTAEVAVKANNESQLAILGDPVVRSSINHAIAHFCMGHRHEPIDEAIPAIIEIAGEQLKRNSTMPPLQTGRSAAKRLGLLPHHGWIWSDQGTEDAPARYFRAQVDRHLAHDGLKLIVPSREVTDNLVRGAMLLGELLPELSRSALGHSHCVAIVAHRGAFISVTNPSIPGVIFLSESAATSPWEAADNLLHESLHAKFLDIEHTHAIMSPGYKPTDCLVRPPWRRPLSSASYLWPLTRLFTVTHVYVAMAVFFSVMEEKSSALTVKYGHLAQANPLRQVRHSLDRAGYLVQQLLLSQRHLGPAGVVFAKWLMELLNRLDYAPCPAGSYLHLIADLYQQEANLLAPSIARMTADRLHSKVNVRIPGFENNTLAEVLQQMLQIEIASIQRVAEQSGHNVPWTTILNNTLMEGGNQAPQTLAANLWSVRALLSQSLLQIKPGRFTSLNEPMILEDMLLSSSRYIEAALHSVRAQ